MTFTSSHSTFLITSNVLNYTITRGPVHKIRAAHETLPWGVATVTVLEALPEPQGRASVVQAMIFSGLPEAGGQNHKASSIPGPRDF